MPADENNRIGLLCSEPIQRSMGGIGIRFAEFARRLHAAGFPVTLVSPGDPSNAMLPGLETVDRGRFGEKPLADLFANCACVVAQGQLANNLVQELPGMPAVIDLYDPWLLENLHYADMLGPAAYRNDHASWVAQMSRGDFFLCSSHEQRLYYLGFLTAMGRVNPERVKTDPDLRSLIAELPFGVPDTLPDYRPYLAPRQPGQKRLLFGGLYDWYDPWTLLEALDALGDVDWTVLFMRNPNPDVTPQGLLLDVEQWAAGKGTMEQRIRFLDWAPAERRFDLLRDVDVLVAPHRPTLETRLSLRTRYLDAMAAGCPVVATRDGTLSDLMATHDAGWVVPPGDSAAMAAALGRIFSDNAEVEARRERSQALVAAFRWSRVIVPLIEFCRHPVCDATKAEFAARPEPTPAPRWWRR